MALIGAAPQDIIDLIDEHLGIGRNQFPRTPPFIGRDPGPAPAPSTNAPGRIGAPAVPSSPPDATPPAAPAPTRQPAVIGAPAPQPGLIGATPPAVPADPALEQANADYRNWEAAEPKAPTRDQYKSPLWRKLVGAGAAGLIGYTSGDPKAGIQIGRSIIDKPFNTAEDQYKQDESEWDKRGTLIGAAQTRAATQGLDRATEAERYALAQKAAQPASDEWQPIAGTNLEVNKRNGESRPIQGMQPPERKPQLSNPFEAFAYGTPEERKAAQDFLTLEKRTGAQFRNPSELGQRYSLYKRDPDAYKAMFGNRGDAQDQATNARTQAQAARMLKYFDGQRKEIQNSFLMDDTEKQQRLAEIDQLEKPYRDAAQVNAGPTDQGDTIQVINPNGTAGTIPIVNLKKALKKGYKLAPNQ